MNTYKISNLERKVQAISTLPLVADSHEWAEKFIKAWDMSVPIAMAMQRGWIKELSDEGAQEIEQCFLAMSAVFEKTPEEMLDYLANPD